MSDRKQSKIYFTMGDLSALFDRSPVSLRQWQKKGYIYFNGEGIRKLCPSEVKGVAKKAREIKGVNHHRLDILEAAMTLLEILEEET
jgi:hypothetical protein